MKTTPTLRPMDAKWLLASFIVVFVGVLSAFLHTLLLKRELTASVEKLEKQIKDGDENLLKVFEVGMHALASRCAQPRIHNSLAKAQGVLKQRKIRSVSSNNEIWKMMEKLTAGINGTVIVPVILSDKTGRPGPKGPPGDRGPKGKAGPVGPVGPKGMKGDQGQMGRQGAHGDQGKAGEKGEKGEGGLKGHKGDSVSVPMVVTPPQSQTVVENGVATFTCKAIGNPLPDVKLTRPNKTMDERYKKVGKGMLEITDVQYEDDGEVLCSAKSALGEDRRKAKLTVLVKAKAEMQEKSIEGEEGYDIHIKCNVKGIPLPEVKWQRLSGQLPDKVVFSLDKKTLTIKQAKVGDGGKYVCYAINHLMNSSDIASIRIERKLSFLIKPPRLINSIKLLPVEIYCFYENGVGPVKVTWLKDKKKISSRAVLSKNSQILSFAKIDKEDAGEYKCLIQSAFSTIQGVTKVYVSTLETCKDIRRTGRVKSGNYMIFPWNDQPVRVYCDMDSSGGTGVTVISHDSEARTIVDGFEDPGSYRRRIKYTIPDNSIKGIIAASTMCEQYVRYECRGSLIENGSVAYAWWVSSSGAKMSHWGGTDHTKKGCFPRSCTCDANDAVWREDSWVLKEKKYLPISEVRFGDTGAAGETGYHTIGKLKCS